MNYPNNIIIIQGLKQCIVSFYIGIKFLGGSSPSGTLNGLVTAFAT